VDGTLDIQNDAFASWDVVSEIGNTGSEIADIGVVSVHDSGIGF
jgi:hypothetical protein